MRDPFICDAPHAIHFSGGRTSGLMLRRHLDAHGGTLPEDVRVLFCNTGKEREETLDFVERCSREWSVPVTWLEYRYEPEEPGDQGIEVTEEVESTVWEPDDNDELQEVGRARHTVTRVVGKRRPKGRHSFVVVDHATASRNGEPFEQAIQARGFLPNVVARFCTVEMKIRTAKRYLKSLGWEHWTSSIGLRADEPARVARLMGTNRHSNEDPEAPLHKAGIMRADVEAFWRAQPFDLGLMPHEGNCDLCFLKGRSRIERVMHDRPDLAEWWIAMEEKVKLSKSARNASFRADRPRYRVMLKQVQEQPMLPGLDEDEPLIDCMCGGEA